MTRKFRVLLGITGSIAAYKSPSIARALLHAGFEVRAALTQSAQNVIGEAALRSILPDEPYADMWHHRGHGGGEVHITWAEWADCILIAPATASCLADLRAGRYDNCVTLLAANLTADRWFIAPGMSGEMWQQQAVQENVEVLKRWGAQFLGPVQGEVASGNDGQRMLEPRAIAEGLKLAAAGLAERNRPQSTP